MLHNLESSAAHQGDPYQLEEIEDCWLK